MTTTLEISDKVKSLALDLNKAYPRSPRAVLGGYVIAARAVDKCRALLNGTVGEYHYNCPLDQKFFEFSGISSETFQAFVATGASDEAIGEWIQQHRRQQKHEDIVAWNNQLRYLMPKDVPVEYQVMWEEQIIANPRLSFLFDFLDHEEGRL